MATLTLTVHKTVNEFYYFRLRKADGAVLLTSRNYISFRKCVNNMYAVRLHSNLRLEE